LLEAVENNVGDVGEAGRIHSELLYVFYASFFAFRHDSYVEPLDK